MKFKIKFPGPVVFNQWLNFLLFALMNDDVKKGTNEKAFSSSSGLYKFHKTQEKSKTYRFNWETAESLYLIRWNSGMCSNLFTFFIAEYSKYDK